MKWVRRFAVSRDGILANRWIRPFAHRLTHPSLWHLNRWSVSRCVALGLVAGFLIPVGQIVVAALFAFSVRANIVIAATATLVTNPLTFPPIYYAAYRVGRFLLGTNHGPELTADQLVDVADKATEVVSHSHWTVSNVLLPLAVGLVVFAAVSGVAGFFLARLFWTVRVRRRWRRRVREPRRPSVSGRVQ